MGEPVVIVGAEGFVGSAVRAALLWRGFDVRATARKEGAGDVVADILRPETLDAALRGAGTLVHAAGAAHVFRRTADTESWMRRTNVDGTRNVVAAARRAGISRVVVVSSVSAAKADDVYARSKLDAEQAALEEAGGAMTLTLIRLATAYGEGDRGNVLRLIRAIDRGRFVWIGRGDNRKSLIHRDDAGEGIAAVAAAPVAGVFNLSAPPVTMHDVVAAIARALGRPLPRFRINDRVALATARALRAASVVRMLEKWCCDEMHDGSEFTERFGVRAKIGIDDGIAREVAWYRATAGA